MPDNNRFELLDELPPAPPSTESLIHQIVEELAERFHNPWLNFREWIDEHAPSEITAELLSQQLDNLPPDALSNPDEYTYP